MITTSIAPGDEAIGYGILYYELNSDSDNWKHCARARAYSMQIIRLRRMRHSMSAAWHGA